ncbi:MULTISPECIES: hypothetical protein [unclassified Ensifer]|uniref:hypothetical protein n=1 Tax=unclassified Ensifer TaxID=2633371 RepID=UPI001FCCC9B2|nr:MULTISPECIES: hypothetical protein [unclassified Ensifer]
MGIVLIGALGGQPMEHGTFLLQFGNEGLSLTSAESHGPDKQEETPKGSKEEGPLKKRTVVR